MKVLDIGIDKRDVIINKINNKIENLKLEGYEIDDIGIGDVVINTELFATGYIVYHQIEFCL